MLLLPQILGIIAAFSCTVDALSLSSSRQRSGGGVAASRASPSSLPRLTTCTALRGWINNNGDDNFSFGKATRPSASVPPTLITPQMEEEVLASARATMDTRTVSRAVSSLLNDNNDNKGIVVGGRMSSSASAMNNNQNNNNDRGGNKLRDLAAGKKVETTSNNNNSRLPLKNDGNTSFDDNMPSSSSSWNAQQIAIASGVTVMLLSPIVIPIIHVLLPPVIPSPSSISFTGAALLGALSYIVALGDPTTFDLPLGGEGVEVSGAVSRIVGRTALQTAKASAPRVKAVARAAILNYDETSTTIEQLQNRVDYLSAKTFQLDNENQLLRYELALYNAVEEVGGMYKLEELKELARLKGVRGYSTDNKNALLRRLVKEQILELDLTPYYYLDNNNSLNNND